MDNADLRSLWLKGDERSFAQIFDALYEPLVVYCRQFVHDTEEAKDLAQNSFIKLWEKRDSLTLDRSLKSYLYSMAYNLFVDTYRENQKTKSFLDELKYEALQEEVELNEEEFQRKIQLIEQAIEALPKKCRLIFIMHKKQGYSHKEIAQKLELSPRTVEAQIGIALHKIREKLSEDPMLLILLFFNRGSSK